MSKALLRVGVDATCWTNGRGYGRFTREIVTAMARRADDFHYTLVFDRRPEGPLPPGADVIVGDTRTSLDKAAVGATSRTLDYLFRMGELVRKASFDVFFFPALYSYFPLLARTPCVVCYHDTIPERFPELIFPTTLNRRLWQLKTACAKLQTTRAMTVSQTSAADIENLLGIPRRRIDVVCEAAHPAFCPSEDPQAMADARRRCGVPAEAPLLVYVGGFNRHKNVLRLLQAMRLTLAQHQDAHLVLVGDLSGAGFWDNLEELRAFVEADPQLSSRVSFPGYVEDAILSKLLSSASALVFPSLAEGFGLPAVEAMSCGCPVLASNRGSLPEIVGDAGLLFDPEDVDDMAGRICSYLSSPALQLRLREAALRRAALFTWDLAAEAAETSLRRAVGRRTPAKLEA